MDLTERVSNNKNDVVIQHDCLHVAASIKKETDPYQIISFCLTDWPSKWNIQENNLDQKFTFDELYKQNITSQQLYFWSAPMDVIERYQLYLNYLLLSNKSSSMSEQLFYNCTSPRFGPLCQYSLDIYESHYSSLNEFIYNFYQDEYEPTTLTCYIHLECNRGSSLACLDWSEICDGFIDCHNGGIDEEHCWKLELNECRDNEYRCDNGQCISKIYFHDDFDSYECLDGSDENRDTVLFSQYYNHEPMFSKEDVTCSLRYFQFSVRMTSSCVSDRNDLLKNMIFSDRPNSLSEKCWFAFKCNLRIPYASNRICDDSCPANTCKQIINDTCPSIIFMPDKPLLFGHIYLAFLKEDVLNLAFLYPPVYICYNDQLCGGFYSNVTLLKINNSTCRRAEDFPISFSVEGRIELLDVYLKSIYTQLHQCNTIIQNTSAISNSLTMYRCSNSTKFISKYRLCDGINDCDYKDDEQCTVFNGTCSIIESETLLQCTTGKCVSLKKVGTVECDCGYDEYNLCTDEPSDLDYITKHISFPTICDGFTELIPIIIDGRNETDETECEYWQCNNTYTRCDGFWNCLDGADEVNCNSSLLLKCPFHHHTCVSSKTYQLICLPIEKANDGNIDCLGATDEPKLCRSNNYEQSNKNFHCKNDTNQPCITSFYLCEGEGQCMHGDDEVICNKNNNNTISPSVCRVLYPSMRTDVHVFLCERLTDTEKKQIVHFSIDKSKQLTIQDQMTHFPFPPTTGQYNQRCHRGLPLRVWLNSDQNLTNITCLCPPSFYGDMCQYQNQRVSLTLQFQTFSGSRRTLFALIVSLIDDSDQRIIHSYQQLTYLYIQHCRAKFNIYLLYSTRPKLSTKNYFIHIDIYEKLSFAYRGSLLIPLNHPFLPVHRIALQLNIPRINENMDICSDQKCIHGRCITYSDNTEGTSFCHCDGGWSGKYCTIPYTCTCSSDSLCVGVSANNRSICICPLNKWGSQCLLYHTICHSNENATCENGGQCIIMHENTASDQQFICICREGFSGERCEHTAGKIIVTFHKDIDLPQSILFHFIQVIDNNPPENGSTFKNIPINQRSVTIQWSRPFHIVFAELVNNSYYLIAVQKIYNRSEMIIKTINPSDRCEHISKVLNETIVNFPLLRRIKYYHLPCQRRLPLLSCFYDDSHFCLCNDFGNQRIANCFEFNPAIKHDCFGQSICENGAQCLQDNATCPQTSICLCPKCFYGTRCQFSSNLFGLSLDAILGYHIQPHINIIHQPHIVQVSIALTIIMVIVGFVNGILSVIIFKNKEARKIGSGYYLLGSSITTLFTMTIFAVKFWILIIAQMTYMTNRFFLQFQCILIDFLLRIGLNIDQWLNACVAMERAITTIKGPNFNKEKSKRMAKYIIICVLILIISTTIHDPIYRHLIDDIDSDDKKRIWCIVTYPSSLQMFNLTINIIHFFVPFVINLVSAFIIIKKITHYRRRLQAHETYRQLLFKQFQRHSHIFLAPVLLIILAIPRLLISVTSGCMKSNNDSWLFIIGYFISFIPSTLTFVVFVFPSKLYRQIFFKSIKRYRRIQVHPIF